MKSRTRARLLWTMAIGTAAYAFVNIVIFFTTGTFGTGWFVASLFVYGTFLVAAVALAVFDTGDVIRSAESAAPQVAPSAKSTEAVAADPEEISREVIYRTRTGRLIRARYRTSLGKATLYYALMPQSAHELSSLEARIDDLPLDGRAAIPESEFAAALARRALPPEPSAPPEARRIEPVLKPLEATP